MSQVPRLFPAWFVYETVMPLLDRDGWRRVEHRINPKSGHRETHFLDYSDMHRPSEYALGAFTCSGRWFVSIDLGDPNPTWGVIDSIVNKTFIISAAPHRGLGRPVTFSLPTDDLYTYPGEYVVSC